MSERTGSLGWRASPLIAVAALVLAGPWPAKAVCEPSDTVPSALAGQSGCHLTELGITPLSDLGCGTYRGEEGGLYPDGASFPPAQHWLAGWAASGAVVPRRADGTPDSQGAMGFASIGMSNTAIEFAAFENLAKSTPGIHPRLVIVNGAQGGRPAEDWAQPSSPAWNALDQRLAAAGLSAKQLQVVWIKQANSGPAQLGEFPDHAESLALDLFDIVRNAKARYPNLAIAYLSSRTRAYVVGPGGLSPEPFAYESGFSVKWLIAQQIAGNPALRFAEPDAPAPWLAWGPYIWADGEVSGSDGFSWQCADTRSDFTHPSAAGAAKIAGRLLGFLRTELTASGWFVAPHQGCGLLGIEPVLAVLVLRFARRLRRRATA